MKLIIREYLASLRERNELDSLLPDLLSQMGLEVFSKPGTGNRQYGVDVAAFGSIEDEPDKVYLFSVKAGNLGRKDWNSGSVQDLQPSLDEIRDTYIPTHLPTKYKDKPVEICICFGGDLKGETRLNVSTYEDKHSTDTISFSEWGGEKLSAYIEKYLLREELLPDKCHSLLRKSLAMLDEPDVSLRHYRQLISLLSSSDFKKQKDRLTAVRQIYLCLWITYAWCREADNVEVAFQAGELTLLYAWSLSKPHLGKNDRNSRSILETTNAIQILNIQINSYYLQEKIIPHTGKLYAISNAVQPSCHLDVNLKLFDTLGRLALSGLWLYWYLDRCEKQGEPEEVCTAFQQSIDEYHDAIKKLIANNPALFNPYKDDQAIDITLAVLFLAIEPNNRRGLHAWLINIVHRIYYLFQTEGIYPCHLNSYHELLEHPINEKEGYKEKVTQGSVLYPFIAAFAALFEFDDVYSLIRKLKTEHLAHCNFQVWYPDETSENHYYINDQTHGTTLSHVPIDKDPIAFLDEIFKECTESIHFNGLSAVQYGIWPLILLASRHYRLPVPIHYLMNYRQKES